MCCVHCSLVIKIVRFIPIAFKKQRLLSLGALLSSGRACLGREVIDGILFWLATKQHSFSLPYLSEVTFYTNADGWFTKVKVQSCAACFQVSLEGAEQRWV